MTLTTSILTGRLPFPDDTVPANAYLRFTLSGVDTEGENILHPASRVVELVSGEIPAGFDLWRNSEGSRLTTYSVDLILIVADNFGRMTREQVYPIGTIQIGVLPEYDLADLLVAPIVGMDLEAQIALINAAVATSSGAASAAATSANQAALYDGVWVDDVAALFADDVLTYVAGTNSTVAVGSYVRTRKEGFCYRVETAVLAGADVTTAGGIRLTVVPSLGVVSVAAYGAVGDGIADDTTPCQKALASGAHVVFPAEQYKISGSLMVGDQRITGRGNFEARAQTRLIMVGNIAAFRNVSTYWNSFEIEGFFIDYGLTTPVAAAGNDEKIGFKFTNALAGGTITAWPEQIRITNCTIQGGWLGFYDDTGTYQSVIDRVEARNCKTGFYKQNGTTIVFIATFARGDGWLEASPKKSEMGFFIREVLAVTLIGCAADGLTPAGEAYGETANMFEGARGVTITGWDAESNDIGPNKSYMRITSGTADIRGFTGYQNTLRAEIGEESTLILNDGANVSFGGMTSLNPVDLAYVGTGGVPIAIKTINGGRTLVSASIVRIATGGTPGAAFALLGATGTSVDYVATETDGLVSGASELISVDRLAALPVGSLGTHGMFLNATTTLIAEGDIVPGTSLIWCAADGGISGVDSPAGSWRCLGTCAANAAPAVPNPACVSLFRRVV